MAKGKYHERLKKDNLIKLEAWARDGLTDEQIANNIGITTTTLYERKKRFPDISESLKRGKEVVDIEVENAMLKKALGYTYEEEKAIKRIVDGKETTEIVKIKKHSPPDTTALIFWLKNRKPDVWMDRKAKEISPNQDTNLERYFQLLDDRILNE